MEFGKFVNEHLQPLIHLDTLGFDAIAPPAEKLPQKHLKKFWSYGGQKMVVSKLHHPLIYYVGSPLYIWHMDPHNVAYPKVRSWRISWKSTGPLKMLNYKLRSGVRKLQRLGELASGSPKNTLKMKSTMTSFSIASIFGIRL